MDPFSLSVGIVSLVGLAATTLKYARNYLSGARDAKNSVAALIVELEALQSNLSSLDEFLRSDSTKGLSFQRTSALRSCASVCECKLKLLCKKLGQAGDTRTSRFLWPLSEKEHLKTIQELQAFTQWLQFALSVDGCSLLSRTSDNVLKVLSQQMESFKVLKALEDQNAQVQDAIRDQTRMIQDACNTRKKYEILNWISKQSYIQRHHAIRCARAEGTGGWLLEQEEYRRWRDDVSSSNGLWCHGIQGSGKTVLTSLVIDELQGSLAGEECPVAFWYFDYQDQDNQTPRNMISAILRQVAATISKLPEILVDAHKKFHDSSLPMHELQNLLIDIIKTYGDAHRTYIIIDALDECDESRHRRVVLNFIERLKQILSVRIFVTSRQRPHDINAVFHAYPQIEIEAQESDLMRYMYQEIRVANVEDFVDEKFATEIVDTIIKKAQGMFLLPILQLRTVLKEPTAGAMEDTLASLSRTLPDAFNETINRIQRLPESRRQLGMSALMWISHAKRSLMVTELAGALSIKSGQYTVSGKHCPSASVMLACCQGLVTIDRESSIIRLAHYSVQEYLTEHSQRLFMNAEASLAGICIRYLLFDTFRDGPWADKHQILELIQRNPFLAYAAPFWGIHVQKSETDPHIQNLTVDFFRHHNGVAAAHQVTQVLKQRKDIYWYPEECLSLTPLHISSHFGLETMTRILLDQTNLAVDATTNMGTTPLIKAASRGHVLIINMLLQKGADPYLENWYGTAIHCAAEAGHSNTITELIRHGMSPNSCAGVYKRTPLDCTLDNNHAAAFETLIKLEADIYVPNEYGLTVFQEAMRHDCVKIIDLILRRGWADLETLSAEGFPAIHYAVMGQNATTLIKLLDAGADVNARDQHMFTALQLAKQDNSAAGKEIVTLLLARGAIDDLDSNDEGEGNMDVDGGDAEMLVEDLSRQVACP